jgi:hypothetical protein
MRKVLALFACSLLLAGCESFGDLTSDAFDPGAATQSKFIFDNEHCKAAAEDLLSYDTRGITGTHIDRHEMYNRAYAGCMQKNGYARRDGLPNITVPYDVDPWPG